MAGNIPPAAPLSPPRLNTAPLLLNNALIVAPHAPVILREERATPEMRPPDLPTLNLMRMAAALGRNAEQEAIDEAFPALAAAARERTPPPTAMAGPPEMQRRQRIANPSTGSGGSAGSAAPPPRNRLFGQLSI